MFEDFEQMNIGNIESYVSKSKKNKCITKKRVLIFLFLLSIIIIIIYFKFKSPKQSSSSTSTSTPTPEPETEKPKNNLENELDILTKKEEELKNENNKLLSKKESLQKENENLNQQIKELTEQNDKNSKNNEISKEISEKKEKIKDFEKKIKNSKDKVDDLTKKQKKANDKLTDNNSEIKKLEQKIEELEKELKQDESNDKKEEEKKEEEKKDDNKQENNDKKENENDNSDKSKDNSDNNKSDEPNPSLKSRIDSKIINDQKYLDILDKWFKQELKYKLLYRASEEQYSANIFHSKVDQFKNTIIFIKDINNFIYGGFTRKTWDGTRIFKNDQNAIVFNLDKEVYYKINDANHAIFCDPEYLAIFGEGDISLGPKSVESTFPKTYGSTSENKQYELTMGFSKLSPLEMEVFQLS